MFGLDLTPVVYCLFASIVWAPLVYLAARRLDRERPPAISELIWLGGLGLAVLPTMLAPMLAAAGISLRPAPDAAPVVIAPDELIMAAALAANPPAMTAPAVSIDIVIKAVGLLYIYGVVLAFIAWLARACAFAIHVGRARPLNYPELARALEGWRARLHVGAPVRIRKSDAVSSVCVYGVFRPVILIPAELDARVSFNDLVLMGAHELAHVKRGDCVLFAVAAFARILFWFNPFVKRLAARAELAAERSADRLVLEAGADRRAYAACFVEGLRFAAERARETRIAVPSFTPFDRRSRRERLDAILSGKSPDQNRSPRLFMAAAVASAAVLAFAQAALAVDPERGSAEDAVLGPLPVEGEVTLGYGETIDGELGASRPAHEGIDIKAASGVPIKAPTDGVVIEATDVYQGKPAWGKVVVIRHNNGVVTRYAHLGGYSVKRGDRVTEGEVIATVGASGAVTGPHLHFETLIDGERVDPAKAFAKAGAAPEPASPVEAPETPAAPQLPEAPAPPAEVDELEGYRVLAPGERLKFKTKDGGEGVVAFRSDDGGSAVVITDDDGAFAYAFGGPVSDEHKQRLEESLEKMRKGIEKAKAKHAKAMEKMRSKLAGADFDFEDFDFDFDGLDLNGLDLRGLDLNGLDVDELSLDPEDFAAFRDNAKSAMERWKEEHERAIERAERGRERTMERAERDRERAQRDRRRALDEAQRERGEALQGAEIDREEALRRHAEALAEAQRDLAEEQARIEEMLDEMSRKKEKKDADDPS